MEHKNPNLFAIFVPNSPDRHVFNELTEVKNFLNSPLGKKKGTRFKKCADNKELELFYEERLREDFISKTLSNNTLITNSPSTSSEENGGDPISPYASIPIARFNEFRRSIEQKDYNKFEDLIKENPRFLVNTNTDSPALVKEGCRYNTLHVACREANLHVVKRSLELARDYNWLIHVYGTDRCVEERSTNLLDSLLNTPDRVEHNTPLHYACKFGQTEIVQVLLSYSLCKRYPKNKYDERPLDMLCYSFKGNETDKKKVEEEIKAIFKRGYLPSQKKNLSLLDSGSVKSSKSNSSLEDNLKTLNESPSTPRSSMISKTLRNNFSLNDSSDTSSNSTPIKVHLINENVNYVNNHSSNNNLNKIELEISKLTEDLQNKLKLNKSNEGENLNIINDTAEDVFEDALDELFAENKECTLSENIKNKSFCIIF